MSIENQNIESLGDFKNTSESTLFTKSRARLEAFMSEFGLENPVVFYTLPKEKKEIFLKKFSLFPQNEVETYDMYNWLITRAIPIAKKYNESSIMSPYPDLESYYTPISLAVENDKNNDDKIFGKLDKLKVLNPKNWYAFTLDEKKQKILDLGWEKDITNMSEDDLNAVFNKNFMNFSREISHKIPNITITGKEYEVLDSRYEKSVWISENSTYLGYGKTDNLPPGVIAVFEGKRGFILRNIVSDAIQQFNIRNLDVDTKIDILNKLREVIVGDKTLVENFGVFGETEAKNLITQYGLSDATIAKQVRDTLLSQEKTLAPLEDKKILNAIGEFEETDVYADIKNEMKDIAIDTADWLINEIKENRQYYELLSETGNNAAFDYEDFPEEIRKRHKENEIKLIDTVNNFVNTLGDMPEWRRDEIKSSYVTVIQSEAVRILQDRISKGLEGFTDEEESD